MGVRLVPDATRVIVRGLWDIEGLTRLSESLKRMAERLNRHPFATFSLIIVALFARPPPLPSNLIIVYFSRKQLAIFCGFR